MKRFRACFQFVSVLAIANLLGCDNAQQPGDTPAPAGAAGTVVSMGAAGAGGSSGADQTVADTSDPAPFDPTSGGEVVGCLAALLDPDQTLAIRQADPNSDLDVAIGGTGCFRYRRITGAGGLEQEILLRDGVTVFDWTLEGTDSLGYFDRDGDGYNEWESRQTPAALSPLPARVDSRTAEQNGPPLERISYVVEGENIRVLGEAADPSGGPLVLVREDIGELDSGQNGGDLASTSFPLSMTDGSCTTEQLVKLAGALDHAFKTGSTCLQHYGADSLILTALFRYTFGGVMFRCRNIAPKPEGKSVAARLDPTSFTNRRANLIFEVNLDLQFDSANQPLSPPGFFSLSEYEQAAVLFHELLHSEFGGHLPGSSNFPGYAEYDRVEACTNLCFGPAKSTRCGCATCLDTTKCDERCESLPSCDAGMFGFRCPCPVGPTAYKVYSTCTECLTACPQGLQCAGYHTCDVLESASCPSDLPATCP